MSGDHSQLLGLLEPRSETTHSLPSLRSRRRRVGTGISSPEAAAVEKTSFAPPRSGPYIEIPDATDNTETDDLETPSHSEFFGSRNIVITPPKAPRSASGAPSRRTSTVIARSSTVSWASVVSMASTESGFRPMLLGQQQVCALALKHGWRVFWPQVAEDECQAKDAAAPGAAGTPIVIAHTTGRDGSTAELLQRARRDSGGASPIFVLLSDASGAGADEYDLVTGAHRTFVAMGADDVVCNTRTSEELRLAIDLAGCRWEARLSGVRSACADVRRDVEGILAERARELDTMHSTGMFWQSVDRLFRGFPKMNYDLPAEVRVGTEIGSCTLGAPLGQGSFGKVYSAFDMRSKAEEAVKVIPKSSITQCKQASALFREMHLHKRLHHKHIIRMRGMMHGPLHVFIRMEPASRETLFKRMKAGGGALAPGCARRFQAQLANAVAYCHAQHVAHRDLKPENIGLDASHRNLKVLDFGSCVSTEAARADIVGSVPFMAPELFVASDERPYDAAGVDVWACGVVLLEMLCGLNQLNRMLGRSRSPSVNPEEFVELKRFFNDGPGIKPALKEHLGDADVALVELFDGMLQVDPTARWTAQRVLESTWLARRRPFPVTQNSPGSATLS